MAEMEYFTEKFGFESDDLDAVTAALSRALELIPDLRFNDSYGGDISVFGKRGAPGGRLVLYHNHTADITGSIVHEDDFSGLGLILLIEQRGGYVNYENKLGGIKEFEPVLLHRSRYESDTKRDEVLFDLAKKHSKSKP